MPASGGHHLFVQTLGNPRGYPVVLIHGGPGSGCNPDMVAPFDSSKFRLVLIDQRGCGRSRPSGSLRQNTTQWLISDIERVRITLGIERWHAYGGSWGATLALAYAGTHPHAVGKLLLRSLFLASHHEIRNLFEMSRHRHPRAWRALYNAVIKCEHETGNERQETHPSPSRLLDHVRTNLSQPARNGVDIAAAYSALEAAILNRWKPGRHMVPSALRALQMRNKYRIQSHYLSRHCFLRRSILAEYAQRAQHAGVRGIALHGRHDPLCPPTNMQWLRRHMPSMEVRLVDARHLASEPAMRRALELAAHDLF